jgi:quercetin dioxygenase-like cupin family protein
MVTSRIGLLVIILLSALACQAQMHHSHNDGKGVADGFPAYKNVLTKVLTDSGLVNKEIKFLQMTLAPGASDTIAHRHQCEVFIYVQEGSLVYREGSKKPVTYRQGEILHEIPYSLHTLHANASTSEPVKLLLVFLYTTGKPYLSPGIFT